MAEYGDRFALFGNDRISHTWGRWVAASDELKADGYTRELYYCKGPGRGAFALTEIQL